MNKFFINIEGTEYKIWSDKRQWKIAEYHGEASDGTADIRNTKYYSKIENLIDFLVRRGLKHSDYESFQDIKDNLNRLRHQVNSFFDSNVLETES